MSPIIDLYTSRFDTYLYFVDQGYDIYEKYSDFYQDICAPAHLYDNDIILKDRKIDIYPNNVILCKENCYYAGIIIEEKKVICKCNLNINNKENDIDKTDDFLKEEDNGNFMSYLLDKINYKINKCYKLLLSFDNLKNNISFYLFISLLFINLVFNLMYIFSVLPKIKIMLFKDLPNPERKKTDKIKVSRKQNKNWLFKKSS